MARDRRRKLREEPFDRERWLISYADFITLLFAFFVIMYAISSVNEGKFRVLSKSLTSAFQVVPRSPTPIQVGHIEAIAPPAVNVFNSFPSPLRITGVLQTTQSKPQASRASTGVNLPKIGTLIKQKLTPLINQNKLEVMIHKNWIDIRLGTDFLFSSGSMRLSPHAYAVIRKVAKSLSNLPIQVQVQGFTDNIPIHSPIFPSNWELSAARAATVVSVMVQDGIPSQHLAAVGFGKYHPIASNATLRGRTLNRRVDLVILPENANISTEGMPGLFKRLNSNVKPQRGRG